MTRPLLIALGCAVAALLVLGGLWRWEHGKAVRAGQERDAAVSQAALATETTHVVERYHNTETVIREAADPAIQTITEATGAETPIPDDVRSAWINGIDSLRAQPGTVDNPDSKPTE